MQEKSSWCLYNLSLSITSSTKLETIWEQSLLFASCTAISKTSSCVSATVTPGHISEIWLKLERNLTKKREYLIVRVGLESQNICIVHKFWKQLSGVSRTLIEEAACFLVHWAKKKSRSKTKSSLLGIKLKKKRRSHKLCWPQHNISSENKHPTQKEMWFLFIKNWFLKEVRKRKKESKKNSHLHQEGDHLP